MVTWNSALVHALRQGDCNRSVLVARMRAHACMRTRLHFGRRHCLAREAAVGQIIRIYLWAHRSLTHCVFKWAETVIQNAIYACDVNNQIIYYICIYYILKQICILHIIWFKVFIKYTVILKRPLLITWTTHTRNDYACIIWIQYFITLCITKLCTHK